MRAVLAILVTLLPLCGCVERRLFVRTEPAGAMIRVNGHEVGTAPATWRFDPYGTATVEADLAGHEPVLEVVPLAAPWYEWPVIDFFADVVWPWTIHDRHEVALRLDPIPPPGETEGERERRIAAEMRAVEDAAARLRAEARKP